MVVRRNIILSNLLLNSLLDWRVSCELTQDCNSQKLVTCLALPSTLFYSSAHWVPQKSPKLFGWLNSAKILGHVVDQPAQPVFISTYYIPPFSQGKKPVSVKTSPDSKFSSECNRRCDFEPIASHLILFNLCTFLWADVLHISKSAFLWSTFSNRVFFLPCGQRLLL